MRKSVVRIGLRLTPTQRSVIRRIPLIGIWTQTIFRANYYAANLQNKLAPEALYEAIDSLEYRISKLEQEIYQSRVDAGK